MIDCIFSGFLDRLCVMVGSVVLMMVEFSVCMNRFIVIS